MSPPPDVRSKFFAVKTTVEFVVAPVPRRLMASLPMGNTLSMSDLRAACASKMDMTVPSRFRASSGQIAVSKKELVIG